VTGLAGPFPLPDPPLETPRLRLRPWRPADAAALVSAWADPEVARWTGVPAVADLAVATRWIAGTAALRDSGASLDLVIEVNGAVAGEVGAVAVPDDPVTVEVGWWLGAAHRGQGLAREAVRLFTGWLLGSTGPGVAAAIARCATGNPAAGRVAAGSGFRLAGNTEGGDLEVWRAGRGGGAGTLHT
jgi:RimJ/RimL family protein N-acetyltransferase